MIIIPDKLLKQDFTKVFYQAPQAILMKKSLQSSLVGREAYLSMHAISMLAKGSQHIRTYEGEVLEVKAGEFVVVKKGIYTINDLVDGGSGFQSYLFYFDENVLSEFLQSHTPHPDNSRSNNKLFIHNQPNYLNQFWNNIEELAKSFPESGHKLFPIKITELFSLLSAAYPSFPSLLQGLKQSEEKSLKAFMEKHFDKPLTIEDYAYLTGRSESTFRREFKSKYAITPRKWIIQRRMEKAVQLLSSTPWEVSRIAVEVGYENTSHFISEFKKQYGATPSQYTHNHRMSLGNI